MKRILLVVDCLGWAFHRIALQIVKHLGNRAEFTITANPAEAPKDEWDAVLYFWWKTALRTPRVIKARRTLIGLYDEWSRHRYPDEFSRAKYLADTICVANRRLYGSFHSLDTPCFLTEDGVDLDLFCPQPLPPRFTVGWAGNRVYEEMGLGDYKGIGLIEYACKRIGVPLLIADKQTNPIPYEEMPERFYRNISCYVCASVAEGTPNPVLEALACGRDVLSTEVGVIPSLRNVGHIIRDGEVIADHIRRVRAEQEANHRAGGWRDGEGSEWDWSKKVQAFAEVFGI